MNRFRLDPRLDRDTMPIANTGLLAVRLMNDSRFPWLIAVPQRAGIREIHELTPLDQTMLTFEVAHLAEVLQAMTGAEKMNVAALGNMVPQLHIHIIARHAGDAAWPNPVWGSGPAAPYSEADAKAFIDGFMAQL